MMLFHKKSEDGEQVLKTCRLENIKYHHRMKLDVYPICLLHEKEIVWQ
jgi:hypothetical protein